MQSAGLAFVRDATRWCPKDGVMNRLYQAASCLFLLLALYIGTRSLLDLPYYSRLGPGPGFFPFWLAVGLGTLACAMFYTATFGARQPLARDYFPETSGLARMAAIIVAVGATVFVMEPLGFRLTMFVFVLFLLFAFGGQNILLMVLVAAAGSFGVFMIFVNLLKVPLPIGMLGV